MRAVRVCYPQPARQDESYGSMGDDRSFERCDVCFSNLCASPPVPVEPAGDEDGFKWRHSFPDGSSLDLLKITYASGERTYELHHWKDDVTVTTANAGSHCRAAWHALHDYKREESDVKSTTLCVMMMSTASTIARGAADQPCHLRGSKITTAVSVGRSAAYASRFLSISFQRDHSRCRSEPRAIRAVTRRGPSRRSS